MKSQHSIKVTISSDVILQELENEAVLLNLKDEHYFGLDDVGLRFWQLLQQYGESSNVIAQMGLEYNTGEATLHKDLGKFIVQLEEAGLIQIVES